MPNPNLIKLPFPGIEGAYVIISGRRTRDPETGNGVAKCMSFFFDGGDGVGVEWEPDYGPITKIISCDKDDSEAQEHWFYPYYKGQGYWSQLAVKEEGLPEAFLSGDYERMFSILKDWCTI